MADKTLVYRAHDGFQRRFVRTSVDVCFGGGNLGAGKLHPLDTKVLTPDGWVEIGDLKEGDYVNTPFGLPAKVSGIFEHKAKDIYRLTTNDGRSVECGLEHLWAIRTPKQMYECRHSDRKNDYLTICDTAELIDRLQKRKKSYIPTPDAQEFSEKEFVIPPYILGIMIGDGCLTNSVWTHNTSFYISNTETDIIDKVASIANASRTGAQKGTSTKIFYTPVAAEYKAYCEKVGLNTYSYNRFIPEEYLFGSIRQRKELLAGLMDTDGTVSEKGKYRYSTTSARLAKDFVELCRSLGYLARLNKDKRAYKYTQGVCFSITISTSECIVSSEKHLGKYNKYLSKEKAYIREYKHVYVTSIEKTRNTDARCILVEDPLHLYIVDDYLTTHNSFGAAMATAEPSLDSQWCGLFLRNNLDDIKRGGGLIDSFRELYGDYIQVRISDMPRVTFPSGAFVDFTHVADQTKEAILRRLKGSQYDMIYFDELSNFSWVAFTTILSRNRGRSPYAGKCIATTNPEREHWTRKFIDWYVDESGYIIPERDGVIRYFYIMGTTVDDVVWGNSKQEVYNKCRTDIDRILYSQHSDNWEEYIKSFTFYEGKMSENKEMLERNKGYVGTIAMMGGAERDKLLGGNWNVSSHDEEDCVVTYDEASSVFTNDDQRNGDRWITVDLADSGTNNFIQIAWDGLHIIDIDIAPFTTPAENVRRAQTFATKHNVGQQHIIFDAIRGMYFKDALPQSVPYESYRAPIGTNALQYTKLKDCCYGKLVWLVKHNLISMSDDVSRKTYVNAASKTLSGSTVQDEFCEEARVIRWVDAPNGKKRLMTKKEMNAQLGRGRSMDVMDAISMRMLPLLNVQDGLELESSRLEMQYYQDEIDNKERIDIYEDLNFGISYG